MGAPATTTPERSLTMEFAGGVVKHLGLSMYRGAVPALAELIANAWDADASEVQITMPLGKHLEEGDEIRVKDTGRGMTWTECQEHYLVVGRDRRAGPLADRSQNGRAVMGRKGIGKLAGFGIAELVEVRTVRDGWLTHFAMDFKQMTAEGGLVQKYQPTILADHFTSEANGTEIILKRLIIRRRIDEAQFRDSMARRFAILSGDFRVVINGTPLARADTPTQFRIPDSDFETDDVTGVGPVKWWIGFTEKPIANEDARGVAVIVRGKMAQTPFFFHLSGGVHGQHGMQYMTGEVVVNQLDAAEDLVATDRQSLVWSEPMPEALLKWGQDKIRKLLSEWVERRAAKDEEKLQDTITSYGQSIQERIDQLRPNERDEARQVIRKLAQIPSVTDEPDRAKELVDLVLRAFEDTAFFSLLKALSTTDAAARAEVLKLVTELDVFETVKMAELVRARVGVIRKFREMLAQDVPEKPDLQDFLFKHPWLINVEWNIVEHETSLEKVVVDHFKLDPKADEDSDQRVDFFCIATRGHFLIVEVKRPSKVIGQKEVQQIMNYVGYLREYAASTGGNANSFDGILVGHHVSPEGARWAEMARKVGIEVRTWDQLLGVAERIHREYLDVVKARAPEDDPRIRNLPPVDDESSGGDGSPPSA